MFAIDVVPPLKIRKGAVNRRWLISQIVCQDFARTSLVVMLS